ncbi:MAG: hypothetical protein A2V73_07965 [candidate division Zixibacteria bacterium RBG_19FT_COMBO_42_43]|nr:MAG: hypothetical protein A2V73_07965 [candidate division Zixibacteria bacterium RBG_19FT_COMBO_42_43]
MPKIRKIIRDIFGTLIALMIISWLANLVYKAFTHALSLEYFLATLVAIIIGSFIIWALVKFL